MCKSALYAANTVEQAVAEGALVNFGSIVRRFGQNLNLSGGQVVANGSGYYDVIVNMTFTADTAGEVNATLYKDGMPVTGATISVPGSTGIEYAVTIPALIRNKCCCETVFSVKADADITITNAAIVVKKI